MFLPEGEHHEIGLLMANLMLNENDKFVIYLGQSVPLDSLNILKDYYTINRILFFAVANSTINKLNEIVSYLDKSFSGVEIISVTRQNKISLEGFKNVKIISTIDDFNAILK